MFQDLKLFLGIETSAKTVSIAVCAFDFDGNRKILANGSINTAVTHSETLMPLMESILKAAKLELSDIDCFAVTNGPGSFTGLRISISAVKGMAYALDKPVYGVSSLFALSYNLIGTNINSSFIACPVMDARCGQVYNAMFRINKNNVERLSDDRAITVNDLTQELEMYKNEKTIVLGDGVHLMENSEQAPSLLLYQNAVSVCFAAYEQERSGDNSAKSIMPNYLRMPQAERERLERLTGITK